jgi:Zn-dependent peptidase ImmA (M78 family)/transcriptional regulator with XRE-family HTH domain
MVQLFRLSLGWSKKDLATEVGVHASHVSRVEAGRLPLAARALHDYAQALECAPEALCVSFDPSPAEGLHSRSNASVAEWKRDRVWARANLVAMRVGRLAGHVDIEPMLALPRLEVSDYSPEFGEITAAQVVRRLWRLSGPIRSMTGLLEAAGVFVVAEDFRDREVDSVTLRANRFHPTVMYVNAALPADRLRMVMAHELGHLVMDATALESPAELERRASSFAAEFLAPIENIVFDLERVSVRTLHELDELRVTWGLSESSLVLRARERGILSDYQCRSLLRLLNETGRVEGRRPGGAHEPPRFVGSLVQQLTEADYTEAELDEITFLTAEQRVRLFGVEDAATMPRHLSMV